MRRSVPASLVVTAPLVVTAALVAAACSTQSSSSADQIVLAEGQELGGYNPIAGYGELGVSPIYEGLYRPQASDDRRVPDLVAALAQSAPSRIGARQWRIVLRPDVRFSDGSAFDSADVVATYRAVRDPAVASEISTHFAPIVDVAPDGPRAVTVRLSTDADPTPYLLLGIVPSERVEARPASDWSLNTAPVGTGPYRLESLEPDQAVLVARDDRRGGSPGLKRIVYSYVPDDNTRAQRVAAGEIDGANLPPRLADSLGRQPDVSVVAARSADWRNVSLPAGNAFTADPQARLAMNQGVDRNAIVADVLAGKGAPASTPVADVYGAAFEPAAQYRLDRASAATTLDRAGWLPGPDGVRTRSGVRAEFTLLYNAQDTLRRDLAVAFAAAMKPLGVAVTPRGTSWDDIDSRLGTDAVILGGGETPYSIDSQVYDTLHTRVPDSSPYANPGDFTAPGLDRLLDDARAGAPGPADDERYRQIQRIYAAQPSSVFLAFLHHTYATRDSGWRHAAPILEPHSHGVAWGPWWDLESWRR
ncbi:ABC transporter substrate-binding protein [Gordonia soli]|uniref:Putative ABC transporter substrate-binding protein n=1 Tax=Gordonia soli NBRC 108243 TaxID=1223545 RepID=M0QFJ7_9ACTN|nr:ABC transporter substrate-binding protein [Gordonia soli]GAC67360.1 putative ABC transporter substrate-binding protein [Gordonia soli NBRC 108243]